MTPESKSLIGVFTSLALMALIAGAVGYIVGWVAGNSAATRAEHVSRPLPVSWSNFGTCGAEALGDNFVRWTCRIEQ